MGEALSNKTTKYHPSPPRKEKKIVRPKSTHNPLGDVAIHKRWSTAGEALFAKLCIERNIKEEVYLVAYLASYLCVFVLLGKDVNYIPPSTFKMASLMTNGRRVNLAIPVLATIYEGLNAVAISPKPVGTSHSFLFTLSMVSMLLQDSLLGLSRVAWSKDDEIFW
ncbi:UNVERIFIED_CONTAM: hypothetical protein Sangu_2539600 [Sesamum angustifolium]|uniref:Uncharacterized protein n=1 Tax=Sesamum angustifolium TaxID=2727405 RepID=A0AAW2JBN0_9LAMI